MFHEGTGMLQDEFVNVGRSNRNTEERFPPRISGLLTSRPTWDLVGRSTTVPVGKNDLNNREGR